MVLKGIKMILAAFGALVVAQAIGLSSASVASIIAILSVVDTRKSSIVIAWKRIISMSLAFNNSGVRIYATWTFDSRILEFIYSFFIPLAFFI